MKSILMVLVVIVTSSTPALADNRCPAGQSGCTIDNGAERIRDRVNEGAKRVIRNENPVGRVREVRDTVRECIECGSDAIKDGADRVSGKK